MAETSAQEIRDRILASGLADETARAFALRGFVYTASYPPDYTADSRWTDYLTPSRAGDELLQRTSALDFPAADMFLALFGLHWWHEPLFDVAQCDLQGVQELVVAEAATMRIRWPEATGRFLYDRAQELFTDLEDELSAEQSQALLSDSAQGVCQVGSILGGPLGFVQSSTVRHYPPQMRLGLFHCPKLDCQVLHHVDLVPPPIPLTEAFRKLNQAAAQTWGGTTRWHSVLSAWPHDLSEGWKASSQMPLFLGDCVVPSERRSLLSQLLESSHGSFLREQLEAAGRDCSGSASAITERLSPGETHQLLLCCRDEDLHRFIDAAVEKGAIRVPTSETRVVDPSRGASTSPSAILELSSLGIRAIRHPPSLLFRKLVVDAYTQANRGGDLDWRLGTRPSTTTEDALTGFLGGVDPPIAIERLVLACPTITAYVAAALDMEPEGSRPSRERLAWKLGFDWPREDARMAAIDAAMREFAETARGASGLTEGDEARRQIRSAGVNAFVEFEGFLEEVVRYVTWVLGSDHPGRTGFVYSSAEASQTVPDVLGAEMAVGSEAVKWRPSGNTLGTLVQYLNRLSSWLSERTSASRESVAREAGATNDPASDAVREFPFRHRALWADAHPQGLEDLAEKLHSCLRKLSAVDIVATRNSLEHYRDPSLFPRAEAVSQAASSMMAFVDSAVELRLFPKLYWPSRTFTDRYGRREIEYVDARGQTIVWSRPQTIIVPGARPLPSDPRLVSPGNLFWRANATLVFGVRPQSDYSDYWHDYPARGPVVFEASDAPGLDEG